MKYIVTLNGKNYEVEVEKTDAVITAVSEASVQIPVAEKNIASSAPAQAATVPSSDGVSVKSPMPGTILSVSASVGQSVKTGQILMILEAMKMENEIVSPCDGTIKQISVSKGSTVETDSVLAVIG